MKAQTLTIILATAILFSSCVKTPQPEEELPPHFSILGDSFSAYEGYVYPETNDVWHYDTIGVTSAEQMWWYKVATQMEWVLDKNNAFSGSLISNFGDFNAGSYYQPQSFLHRMDRLGDPDVIFILGGTNDVLRGASQSEYVYSDWTEEQLEAFRPATAYLLDNLKRLYPKAKLYLLIDLYLNDLNPNGQAFVESMRKIAVHYNVDYIELNGIHKTWGHPDAKGQADIARQVVEAIEAGFNV